MCELQIKTGSWILPHFPVPKEKTTEEHLRDKVAGRVCGSGRPRACWGSGSTARRRRSTRPARPICRSEYLERVEYEMGIIVAKGYPAYFLIVQDFANWAREQGIVITTRGSAAGSLVSYGLGIVSVDPLVYKLPFERFLNPFRPSPPDIDMDFEDSRREEVIEYVTRKYGEDKVAQIITFGTMEAKAAIRDVGRVMGMSYGDVDRISKLIPARATDLARPRRWNWCPNSASCRRTIPQVGEADRHRPPPGGGHAQRRYPRGRGDHHRATGDDLRAGAEGYRWRREAADPVRHAQRRDDRPDEDGLPRAGEPLGPRSRGQDPQGVSRNLDIDLERLPLTDPKAYELLSSGETTGLFQVESGGMRKYLKESEADARSSTSPR